jgi:hypothetical protein
MSSAHAEPIDTGNFRLLWTITFGFRNILEWPTAIQRVAFLLIAASGEFLAATRLFGWLVEKAACGAYLLLRALTPHAAPDLDREPPRNGLRVLVWATALAAIVISLGGNAIFTWRAGTFFGSEPQRFYYIQDSHNLIMYAFVAPIYMAASAAIIYCALGSFSLTARTFYQSEPQHRIWAVAKLGLVLSGIVLIAGLVQVNYYQDNIMGLPDMDPRSLKRDCINRIFWFVELGSGTDGAKVLRLNSAGVYYLCMQFCHMAVVAAAIWLLVTAMFTLYRLGLILTPGFLASNGGAEPVRAKLKRFSLLEVSAKWLALILTVHIAIWGDSCLKGGGNIRSMAMVLLALQFFVLATPRLLIEYRLLKCALVDRAEIGPEIAWPDLVDQRDKVKSTVVSGMHFLVQLALFMLAIKLFEIAFG